MNVHQNTEVLASRSIGYIGRCTDCNCIQVVIGTIISEMSIGGFKNLCTSFDNLSLDVKDRLVKLPDGEKVLLGTGSNNIQMCLSLKDFHQTILMLQEAIIELSLQQELDEILK